MPFQSACPGGVLRRQTEAGPRRSIRRAPRAMRNRAAPREGAADAGRDRAVQVCIGAGAVVSAASVRYPALQSI